MHLEEDSGAVALARHVGDQCLCVAAFVMVFLGGLGLVVAVFLMRGRCDARVLLATPIAVFH